MSLDAAVTGLMLLALLGANWPFFSDRLLLLGPRRPGKGLAWRLLELMLITAGLTALGVFLEGRIGQAHPQGWAFYAVMLCLVLTLAFPGFVWRYLRRRAGQPD